MKTKQILVEIPADQEFLEAARLLDYLTTPEIGFGPYDRSKNYSSRFKPSGTGPLELKDMNPKAALDAVNMDFPESWKKRITKISFKE
jgi:hypothetical protein